MVTPWRLRMVAAWRRRPQGYHGHEHHRSDFLRETGDTDYKCDRSDLHSRCRSALGRPTGSHRPEHHRRALPRRPPVDVGPRREGRVVEDAGAGQAAQAGEGRLHPRLYRRRRPRADGRRPRRLRSGRLVGYAFDGARGLQQGGAGRTGGRAVPHDGGELRRYLLKVRTRDIASYRRVLGVAAMVAVLSGVAGLISAPLLAG